MKSVPKSQADNDSSLVHVIRDRKDNICDWNDILTKFAFEINRSLVTKSPKKIKNKHFSLWKTLDYWNGVQLIID